MRYHASPGVEALLATHQWNRPRDGSMREVLLEPGLAPRPAIDPLGLLIGYTTTAEWLAHMTSSRRNGVHVHLVHRDGGLAVLSSEPSPVFAKPDEHLLATLRRALGGPSGYRPRSVPSEAARWFIAAAADAALLATAIDADAPTIVVQHLTATPSRAARFLPLPGAVILRSRGDWAAVRRRMIASPHTTAWERSVAQWCDSSMMSVAFPSPAPHRALSLLAALGVDHPIRRELVATARLLERRITSPLVR